MKHYKHILSIILLLGPLFIIGCPPTDNHNLTDYDNLMKVNLLLSSNYSFIINNAGTNECNGEYIIGGTFNNKQYFSLKTCNDLSLCSYKIEYDNTYGWCIKYNNTILYYNNTFADLPPSDPSSPWIVLDGTVPAPTCDMISPFIPIRHDHLGCY